MTIKKLAKLLCAREGKKSQVSIANMNEILAHLSDIIFEHEDGAGQVFDALVLNGIKRAAKKAKSKK